MKLAMSHEAGLAEAIPSFLGGCYRMMREVIVIKVARRIDPACPPFGGRRNMAGMPKLPYTAPPCRPPRDVGVT